MENEDNIGYLISDDNDKYELKSKQTSIFPYDETITLKVTPDAKVEFSCTDKNEVLLNGYKVVPSEKYELKPDDLLRVNSNLVFKYLKDPSTSATMKRKNDSTEEGKENESKRVRVPTMFCQMNRSPKDLGPFQRIEGLWECIDNDLLIFTPIVDVARPKIASFDLDGTLIQPKNGKTFPKDHNDWELLHGQVTKKLLNLYHTGHKVVIFTNQLPLGNCSSKIPFFKKKIQNILNTIKVPVQVFVAMRKTMYRKPLTKSWEVLSEKKNNDVKVNLSESFFVGDAAGRRKVGKQKADHSICDRLFALNVGIKFYTPEEYFFKAGPVQFKMPQFNPTTFQSKSNDHIKFEEGKVEIILMVGSPASGKSHFSTNHIVPHGYEYVCRDVIGFTELCLIRVEKALKEGKRCVIDCTNGQIMARKKYLDIAKNLNVPARCFVMNVKKDHVFHNKRFREITNPRIGSITDVAIHSFFKVYERPTIEEGFTEIVNVEFDYKFANVRDERLYGSYLLEK